MCWNLVINIVKRCSLEGYNYIVLRFTYVYIYIFLFNNYISGDSPLAAVAEEQKVFCSGDEQSLSTVWINSFLLTLHTYALLNRTEVSFGLLHSDLRR